MTTAAATTKTPTAPTPPTIIPRERLEEKEPSTGRILMKLTLEGEQTIAEGQQSIHQWSVVGPELVLGQWI